MLMSLCVSIFTLVAATNCLPSQGYQYYPRTLMMGGYYGMQPMRFPQLNPQDNEYIPSDSEGEFSDESVTVNSSAAAEEGNVSNNENSSNTPNKNEVAVPKRVATKNPKKQPEPEDDNSNFPFGQGGSSLFNTFFPIMLGGTSGRGKSGEDNDSPGGATAIANSFSTGRGGIASSHATSFGDVFLSPASRNRNNKIRDAI